MAATDRSRMQRRADHAPTLASTLVTYEDCPDRLTIYPPDTSDVARMATWLTADADAFVDLDRMR